MRALLDALEFPAGDRDRAVCARARARRAGRASSSRRADALAARAALPRRRAARGRRAGGRARGARAGARDAPSAARAGWQSCATCACEITGDDLLAAGMPRGPGDRPAPASARCARKLDGELADGREAELRAALEDCEPRLSVPIASAELRVRAARRRPRAVHRPRADGNLSTLRGDGARAGRCAPRASVRAARPALAVRGPQVHGTVVQRVRARRGDAAGEPLGDRGRRPRDRAAGRRRDGA